MRLAGGLRRRSRVSGNLYFGGPLRCFVRYYRGEPTRMASLQIVVPGVWLRLFWRARVTA